MNKNKFDFLLIKHPEQMFGISDTARHSPHIFKLHRRPLGALIFPAAQCRTNIHSCCQRCPVLQDISECCSDILKFSERNGSHLHSLGLSHGLEVTSDFTFNLQGSVSLIQQQCDLRSLENLPY